MGVGSELIQVFSKKFGIPVEAMPGMPKVTVTLGGALVENHRSVTELSGELVQINCGRTHVRIHGNKLELKAMNESELFVAGKILTVEFD